ncbi:HutD/Ves family protein [Pseudomonas benzenivorans]|uniref:HutD family protein n=1 Tax=Pseudomonas benzenivorans TaxID=556533 RepID=A0ABY5HAM0_9PSED|nr:HutD family protein [Pseudomonas benzenivorans]UTW08061.1 HutD family protein [Pseudomonas benzenivorans]
MNRTQIYRAATYVATPWKNGLGSTLEVARDAGEGLEGFGWRLSIADIDQANGFSSFSGYQRVITVLEGEGMRLEVDGEHSAPLLAFEPFAFSGDSSVHCQLLRGGIRDFNLIYSPERFAARLQWLRADETQRVFTSASTLLLFAAGDPVEVQLDGAPCATLGRYDCLRIERVAALAELQIQGGASAPCCLIELSPR